MSTPQRTTSPVAVRTTAAPDGIRTTARVVSIARAWNWTAPTSACGSSNHCGRHSRPPPLHAADTAALAAAVPGPPASTSESTLAANGRTSTGTPGATSAAAAAGDADVTGARAMVATTASAVARRRPRAALSFNR
jgi:hypothetical protein